MKKKVLKIKWINVLKLIVLIYCVYMILHDLYIITVQSCITGNMYGWTWLGFGTFILFMIISSTIYEDFENQIKNTQSIKANKTKGISK